MKKSTKIIIIILVILGALTVVFAVTNYKASQGRRDLLMNAQVEIFEGEQSKGILDMDEIGKMNVAEFSGSLKSSASEKAAEHVYSGVALSDIFDRYGISLADKSRIVITSADSYVAAFKVSEIDEADNVYLVFTDNGDLLGGYGDMDGQGPYMIVARKDRFAQRWAKYVCEIAVE